MRTAEFWTLDQAHAWTVWRDQESLERVKPGQMPSASTFPILRRTRRRYRASAPSPEIAKPCELDRACAAGELTALRLFNNGTTEPISAREWRDGTPGTPQQIRFVPSEVAAIFPRPEEVAPQEAVQNERPQEGTMISAVIPEEGLRTARYSPEWITLLEAIEHVRIRGEATPGEAAERLRLRLREGKIRSRYWGTNRSIDPLAWYRVKIFSDGSVEFTPDDALFEARLIAIGLGSIRDRVEVCNRELMLCFPQPAQKRRPGPKPGSVDRYGGPTAHCLETSRRL